jgi:SOS response regulatory protein OraA/RecX
MTRRVTALHHDGRRDRVRIELDGAPWRTLPAAAVVAARLTVGTTLDRERARELARARRRAEALDLAARALARSDRSVVELSQYLAQRGVRGPERELTVQRLTEAAYVDDLRFAYNRSDSLARRGYGDAAVRHELERRGVQPEHVELALSSLRDERERALEIVRAAPTPVVGVRRLAAKGFSAETIEEAVSAARLEAGFE